MLLMDAELANLDELIALRGREAFFRNVTPEDFSPDPEGITKVGIAELWSQSTWSEEDVDGRDVAMELSACQVSEGDILVVGGLPDDLDVGENWNEIRDLGFGFWRDGTLLPYSPFHDYNQELFFDTLEQMRPGDVLACVVRDSSCTGQDGEPADADFCWRVYSCKVTVFLVHGL